MHKRMLALLLVLCFAVLPAFAESTLHAEGEIFSGMSDEDAAAEAAALKPKYDPVKKGTYSEAVLNIQIRLQQLGYLSGKPDGSYWTQTINAITSFERTNYLVVTPDYISGETQEFLFSDQAQKANNIICKLGEKNDKILLMQRCLYNWGFFTRTPDGVYGQDTADAVAQFQGIIWSREWENRHKEDKIPYTESNFPTDGKSVDADIYQYFFNNSYDVYFADMKLGSKGPDVTRLQNLLYKYGYLWIEPNGQFEYFTQAAVNAFQKAHGLTVTGVADEATQKRLTEANIVRCELVGKPYRLVVDVDQQRVFAYAWDGEGYNNLVRTMVCSTGKPETPTPVGIYTSTFPQDVWHYFGVYRCWAQYSYVIQGGIMFHSVLYNNVDDGTGTGNTTHGSLDRSSLINLGTRQSHGCVRLAVEDAKWIWTNCPRGTEVEVIQLVPDPAIPDTTK